MTKKFLLLISALTFAGAAAAQAAPEPTEAAKEACKDHMADAAKYEACLKEQETKK